MVYFLHEAGESETGCSLPGQGFAKPYMTTEPGYQSGPSNWTACVVCSITWGRAATLPNEAGATFHSRCQVTWSRGC